MRRGTTPVHIFTTDVDLTSATDIYLTYRVGDENIIEKTKDEMQVSSDQIEVKLSQSETLAINEKEYVYMQIRAKFADGTAIASNIIKVQAYRILKDGEI